MEPINNALATVANGLELAPPEQTLPVTSEQQFIVALAAKSINRRPLQELRQILRLILMKTGLRAENWPTDEEKAVLMAHIMLNYGTHTCEELQLAFDMALTGKLDLAPKDIPCYQNFSCAYLSTILNAYRKWAAEEYTQYVANRPPALQGPREDTSDRGMQEWLNDIIIRAQDKTYLVELIPDRLYDWLETKGKIPTGIYEEPEYSLAAVDRRLAWLLFQYNEQPTPKNNQAWADFKAQKAQGFFTGGNIPILKTLAKKIALLGIILNTPLTPEHEDQPE